MREAMLEARKGAAAGEVPVGAVVVHDKQIVARAHNLTEGLNSPLAHAEMLCLQQAAEALSGWRLLEASLYVTLEPCPMCAGAVLQARLRCLVYGARSLRLGADGSWIALLPGSSKSGVSAARHPFCADLTVQGGLLCDFARFGFSLETEGSLLLTARTRRMRFQLDVMSPRVLGQL
ncbi:hypothetical protein WJX84_010544 [Apatococcus fuscideae]|uniref:CMP/dCMP-type deaminase domain-containing protein n=1 Tax=Apatococcus fuscideae TaxID=2026836 RepID=A0AAW1T259_9CHLO